MHGIVDSSAAILAVGRQRGRRVGQCSGLWWTSGGGGHEVKSGGRCCELGLMSQGGATDSLFHYDVDAVDMEAGGCGIGEIRSSTFTGAGERAQRRRHDGRSPVAA